MNWTAALFLMGFLFLLATLATDTAKEYALFLLLGVGCIASSLLLFN